MDPPFRSDDEKKRLQVLQKTRLTGLTAAALAGAIAVAALGGSPSVAQADTSGTLQPAFTSQDHPITDVQGLVNARELGSYVGAGGERVASSRIIRTESLDKLSQPGAETLATKYDVKVVIDLRTPAQIAKAPDVAIPGAKTVDVSLFGDDGNYSDDTAMYHDLVDKGYAGPASAGPMITGYAQVLRTLAETKTGTVLIHCSHGMDRTGTVFDLLNHILGVSSDDILHDYLLSNTQLGVTWATPELLQGTFESDINSKYGGLDSYISNQLQVSAAEISALRSGYLISSDASLSALSVAGRSIDLAAAGQGTGATLALADPSTVATAAISAVPTNAGATTAVNVSNGKVTITVTAQDQTTTRTYVVNLVAAATATPSVTPSPSAPAPVPSSTPTPAVTRTSNRLPKTGAADETLPIGIAAGLIGLGLVSVVVSRRGRRRLRLGK